MRAFPAAFSMPLAFALASGCSADANLMRDEDAAASVDTGAETAGDAEMDDAASPVRLEVYPPQGLRGDVEFLPQVFSAQATTGPQQFALSEPVTLSGAVTAYRVTPTWADVQLPGSEASTEGIRVSLSTATGTPSTHGLVDATGQYLLRVPPDPAYRFSIVPSTPDLPFQTTEIALVATSALDIALGDGVALWGVVRDDSGVPMAGAAVHAVDAFGTAGAATATGTDGTYHLRLLPGTYTVVCSGRDNGRDPVLTATAVIVDNDGERSDFDYVDLQLTPVSGRAVDEDGHGIASATVRFTSRSLDAYPTAGHFRDTVSTNANGNFDLRLPPGRYQLAVEPSDEATLTPIAREITVGEDLLDIGPTTLTAFLPVQVRVTDATAAPVPDAVISVALDNFPSRIFEAATDATGVARLLVPNSALAVTLTPPATRADLPLTRFRADVADEMAWSFATGTRLFGRLLYPEPGGALRPVAFGVVRAVTAEGEPAGFALTNDSGEFEFSVVAY